MTDAPHDLATKPTIVGELVTLRPFTEADLPTIVEILNDPEVGRLTGSFTSTADLESQPTVLDQRLRDFYLGNVTAPDRLDLAVVDNATGALVGEAVLNQYDPDAGSCNFRILIGPGGRGRGLGTEATRLICDHGLFTVGLHRIDLGVLSFNPRARRAYEKAGFRYEGTRREAVVFDGERVDELIMSRLATDPPDDAGAAPTRGQHPRVSCVFVCHDGTRRVLLARRGVGARDEPGTWDTGAGALEWGESFEDAVAREVREEYRAEPLEVTQVGVRNVVRTGSHWVAVVFMVRVDPDAVAIGEPDTFDEIGWFTPDDLPSPRHSQLDPTLDLVRDHLPG